MWPVPTLWDEITPAIATDSAGVVHAVWSDNQDGDFDVFYSTYNGLPWIPAVEIYDSLLSNQNNPDIAVSTAIPRVVWSLEAAAANNDIYYAYKSFGFWFAGPIHNPASNKENPAVALDLLDNAYVVWSDNRNGNWDIYHTHEFGLGLFYDSEKVNDDTGTWDQKYPVVAFDNINREYVVWQDARNSVNLANEDIYYSSCFR
jgi:hypothetical protein